MGRLHEANRPLHELKPLVFLVRTRSHPSGINLRLLTTDLVSGCDKRSVRTADALESGEPGSRMAWTNSASCGVVKPGLWMMRSSCSVLISDAVVFSPS